MFKFDYSSCKNYKEEPRCADVLKGLEGHELNNSHIGQKIFRLRATRFNNEFDYSFIPSTINRIEDVVVTLQGFKSENNLNKLMIEQFSQVFTTNFPNDSHWVTLEEARKHLEKKGKYLLIN